MRVHSTKTVAVILFLFLFFAFPAWAFNVSDMIDAIDQAGTRSRDISRKIWEWKEPGQKEFRSAELLKAELKKLGYKVTGDLKVPSDLVPGGVAKTAFKAEMKGKGPGPTVTIMVEYDALANGHACGHNLIAASGLLAAAGLAEVMKHLPGRVLVIGTPDEERGSLGGGKVALLEGGHFEGSDVVFITHPADRWSLDQRLLAMKRALFTFKGKSAHAAAAPHKGINALRGVLLTFNCVDSLREHLRQDVRIHGIVTKGGDRVNVVPAEAQAEFACRALDTAAMEEAYGKVVNCARVAELGSGAKLEFKEPRVSLKAPILVEPLVKMVWNNLVSVGINANRLKDFDELASSDLGVVGYAYPTVDVWFKIAPEGTALHSDALREAAISDDAWEATVQAGMAVAGAALELLTDPVKLNAVKASFREMKAREGK